MSGASFCVSIQTKPLLSAITGYDRCAGHDDNGAIPAAQDQLHQEVHELFLRRVCVRRFVSPFLNAKHLGKVRRGGAIPRLVQRP